VLRRSRDNRVARLLAGTERDLQEVRRQLEEVEAEQARLQAALDGKDRAREEESRRRLASYLGAGSIETLSPHRFREDMIRSRWLRRVGLLLGLAALAALVYFLLR